MRTYIYADESGNFDFSRNAGATRYFLLTTVVINDHSVESELLELRRELAWEGVEIRRGFHANNDLRRVRGEVFDVLKGHDFRIDATVFEKRKAEPRTRRTEADFYSFAWYHHLKYTVGRTLTNADEMLITAASIGTSETRNSFGSAVRSVKAEECPETIVEATMWAAASAPCLQVADYCSWAIFRKWERSDASLYELIHDKIASEHDLFEEGDTYYY